MGVVAGDAIEPTAALGDAAAEGEVGRLEADEARIGGGDDPIGAVALLAELQALGGGRGLGPRDRQVREAEVDGPEVMVRRPVAPLAADPPVGRLRAAPVSLRGEPGRVAVQALREALLREGLAEERLGVVGDGLEAAGEAPVVAAGVVGHPERSVSARPVAGEHRDPVMPRAEGVIDQGLEDLAIDLGGHPDPRALALEAVDDARVRGVGDGPARQRDRPQRLARGEGRGVAAPLLGPVDRAMALGDSASPPRTATARAGSGRRARTSRPTRPRRRPARAPPRRARPGSGASSPRGRPDPRRARARTGPRRPARPRAGSGPATSSRRRGRRSRGMWPGRGGGPGRASSRGRRGCARVVDRREADGQLRQARTGGDRGEPVGRPDGGAGGPLGRPRLRQGLGRLAVSRVDLRGGAERGRAEDGPALPRQLATDEHEVFGPQPLRRRGCAKRGIASRPRPSRASPRALKRIASGSSGWRSSQRPAIDADWPQSPRS